jgi:hypothetical protein
MEGDTCIIINQTVSPVCRRTNNYFVAHLCMSVSSLLLQMNCRTDRNGNLSLVTLKEGEKQSYTVRYNKTKSHEGRHYLVS